MASGSCRPGRGSRLPFGPRTNNVRTPFYIYQKYTAKVSPRPGRGPFFPVRAPHEIRTLPVPPMGKIQGECLPPSRARSVIPFEPRKNYARYPFRPRFKYIASVFLRPGQSPLSPVGPVYFVMFVLQYVIKPNCIGSHYSVNATSALQTILNHAN